MRVAPHAVLAMKVRAIAVASERSNAVGTLELECTPHGLSLVHLGVGSFSEDYAPGALTRGTRVLVPWAAVEQAVIEADRLFLSFDSALSPHNRLLLANFSSGRSVAPEALRRQRLVVRAGAAAAALFFGTLGAVFASRFTDGGGALAIGAALTGALGVTLVGLLADRLLGQVATPEVGVREAFERELDVYLPALGRTEGPPPKPLRAPTLAELQGLLPRTTFAVVVTLTASGLAAVLVARFALHEQERDVAPAQAATLDRGDELAEPAAAPAPKPLRAAATVAPTLAPTPSAAAAALLPGNPCRCVRADSLLWENPIPRLSVLLLKQRVRQGRGKPANESVRKRYTDVDIAVVNNGNNPIEKITLVVLFFAKDRGSDRRTQVSSRPLFFEGPLLPGNAVKWSTEAEGTEVEIQAPALGSLGVDGEAAAPSDRFAELLEANNRPVRLHGAMMLAYLADPRAKEGILKLREALREDEAPYLGRLLAAISEVRVCRLNVRDEAGGHALSGCLFNSSAEPRRDLGVKLRGLDAGVLTGDPVGAPPNLLLEQVLAIPGELSPQTGVTFSGRIAAGEGAPAAWEALADRVDLLR
jgi:hypothetical protein